MEQSRGMGRRVRESAPARPVYRPPLLSPLASFTSVFFGANVFLSALPPPPAPPSLLPPPTAPSPQARTRGICCVISNCAGRNSSCSARRMVA